MIGELTGSELRTGDSVGTTGGWTSSVLLSSVGCTVSLVASVSRSTTEEEEVVGIVGPGYAVPLRAEESRVDESELGKPELDRLVPGKLEVGFDLGITLIGSCSINVLSIANGGWTIGEGMRTTISFTVWSNCFHLLVNLKNSHKVFVDFLHSAFSAAIFVSEKELIELDDSLRWAEVSQSLW
uniref:Uncharacterized protein n=1 Tax=Tanacetum cinerariifolium TaxID=118510 RepID=A0A6L2MZN5_TANCI|nr:hypothetical protein [Tanacetum cinerariifolium]